MIVVDTGAMLALLDASEDYHAVVKDLYDENRRNKVLATPAKDVLQKASKKDEWNDYRIRAEGNHIQLWLNGIQTVDYAESIENLDRSGYRVAPLPGLDGAALAAPPH